MNEKKTIRMADGSRSDAFKPYREGHVDVTVSVPIEKFKTAYDFAVRQGWINEVMVLDGQWEQDDMRVAFATLTTVMNSVPLGIAEFTTMLLDTGCPDDVRDAVERFYEQPERGRA